MEFISRGQCGAYCASEAFTSNCFALRAFLFLLSEMINGRRRCKD